MFTYIDEHLEWEANNLSDFLVSNDFKTFAAAKPLSSGSGPHIQLYKTDLEPSTIFSSALTKVFRIPIVENIKVGQVQLAWKQFADSAKTKGNRGTCLNLEGRLFVGVVGHGGAEVSLTNHLQEYKSNILVAWHHPRKLYDCSNQKNSREHESEFIEFHL